MPQHTRRHILGWLGRAGLASFWAAELAEGAAWAIGEGQEPEDSVATSRDEGIRLLRMLAPDLEAQRRFYAETMGFEASITSGVLNVQTGGTVLLFEQAAKETRPVYHVAWAIPENQFQAAKAWLALRTPLLRRAEGQDEFHFRSANRRAVYFADPAGNVLELIARHNLQDGRPGPFTRESILYVNHFALVVDDMNAAVALLKTGLGLETVGNPTPNFTKLGDEYRHLVLVTRGRLWLPEFTVPAGVFLSEVVLAGPSRREIQLKGYPYRIVMEKAAERLDRELVEAKRPGA